MADVEIFKIDVPQNPVPNAIYIQKILGKEEFEIFVISELGDIYTLKHSEGGGDCDCEEAKRQHEEFTGVTETEFTLLYDVRCNEVPMVFKNGLLLRYNIDYTIDGNSLTLTNATVTTDVITIYYTIAGYAPHFVSEDGMFEFETEDGTSIFIDNTIAGDAPIFISEDGMFEFETEDGTSIFIDNNLPCL